MGRPTELTVVTWNLHAGRDEQGAASLQRQARDLAALNPDVALLQEVDRGTARSGGTDQLRALSVALNLPHAAFGAALVHEGGLYGNAILSLRPLHGVLTVPFPCMPAAPRVHLDGKLRTWPAKAEGRCAVLASLEVAGHRYPTLASGHLSLFPEERSAATATLKTVLPDGPLVLGVDSNSEDRLEECWQTALTYLDDLTAGSPAELRPTYPASGPQFAIDALLGRGVETQDAGLLVSDASDHLGLWARIRLG